MFSFTYFLAGVIAFMLLALFLSNLDETYAYILYKQKIINVSNLKGVSNWSYPNLE